MSQYINTPEGAERFLKEFPLEFTSKNTPKDETPVATKVRGIEESQIRLDWLVRTILSTLELNMDRGYITTSDDETMRKLIKQWSDTWMECEVES